MNVSIFNRIFFPYTRNVSKSEQTRRISLFVTTRHIFSYYFYFFLLFLFFFFYLETNNKYVHITRFGIETSCINILVLIIPGASQNAFESILYPLTYTYTHTSVQYLLLSLPPTFPPLSLFLYISLSIYLYQSLCISLSLSLFLSLSALVLSILIRTYRRDDRVS